MFEKIKNIFGPEAHDKEISNEETRERQSKEIRDTLFGPSIFDKSREDDYDRLLTYDRDLLLEKLSILPGTVNQDFVGEKLPSETFHKMKMREFLVDKGLVVDLWFPEIYQRNNPQFNCTTWLKYLTSFCRQERTPDDLRSPDVMRFEIMHFFPGRKGQYFADDLVDFIYERELKLEEVREYINTILPFIEKPIGPNKRLRELLERGTGSVEKEITSIQEKKDTDRYIEEGLHHKF